MTMKFLTAVTILLLGSGAFAKPMSTVIHSICLTSDQKDVVLDMTSPILLPDNTSSDNFQLTASDTKQGSSMLGLLLNADGGMFSNDRRTIRFEKSRLDEKVRKLLFLENMVFVTTLNRTVDYIFVKQCQ